VTPSAGYREIPLDESLYSYRGQTFCPRGGLILRGRFHFTRAVEDQQAVYDHYIQRRTEKQPQGKCCGSVFKNPPGDHAGRLIEACGLKGMRRGGALISPMHANFFMNDANATSADLLWLIDLAKTRVREQFGVELEEEVAYIH
jgi:UDP-N-acetylmuramate dehydrogenase